MPWVDIPNSVFESGKPARALDMRNLRDNITAVTEGDAGAPRIKLQALEELVAGTSLRLPSSTLAGTSSASFVELVPSPSTGLPNRQTFLQQGTIRLSFNYNRSGGIGGTVEVHVLRRRGGVINTVYATVATTSSSPVAASVDLTVLPGDEFYFMGRANGGSTLANVTAIEWKVDAAVNLWPTDTNAGFIINNPL